MKTNCDLVAERVALGEPLGDQAEHAATCARCRRLAVLPAELAATHHDVDPGIGFAARMTAGAQHRVAVRHRRRIAVGLAAAVAATTLGVFVVTREPEQVAVTPPVEHHDQPATNPHDPWKPGELDPDVKALVHLANVERSSHLSAHWARIEKPLAPYRALLKGTPP